MRTVQLPIADIVRDPGLQLRAQMNAEAIEDYKLNYNSLPDVTVMMDDDGRYWLVDGWHRIEAALANGLTLVGAKVVRGSGFRDALVLAGESNRQHGVRRTRADLRRAVTVFLVKTKEEKLGFTQKDIAAHVGVTQGYVSQVAKDLEAAGAYTAREDDPSKLFCDKCQKDGPQKGCRKCAAIRATARGRRKKRKAKSKLGKELYNVARFEGHFGKVAREIDTLADAYGLPKRHEERLALHAALKAFLTLFGEAHKRLKSQKKEEAAIG
jgi:DNA-binding MarR family transcriptional regulator